MSEPSPSINTNLLSDIEQILNKKENSCQERLTNYNRIYYEIITKNKNNCIPQLYSHFIKKIFYLEYSVMANKLEKLNGIFAYPIKNGIVEKKNIEKLSIPHKFLMLTGIEFLPSDITGIIIGMMCYL